MGSKIITTQNNWGDVIDRKTRPLVLVDKHQNQGIIFPSPKILCVGYVALTMHSDCGMCFSTIHSLKADTIEYTVEDERKKVYCHKS